MSSSSVLAAADQSAAVLVPNFPSSLLFVSDEYWDKFDEDVAKKIIKGIISFQE